MECGTIPASFVSVGEGREGVSWGGVGGRGGGRGLHEEICFTQPINLLSWRRCSADYDAFYACWALPLGRMSLRNGDLSVGGKEPFYAEKKKEQKKD